MFSPSVRWFAPLKVWKHAEHTWGKAGNSDERRSREQESGREKGAAADAVQQQRIGEQRRQLGRRQQRVVDVRLAEQRVRAHCQPVEHEHRRHPPHEAHAQPHAQHAVPRTHHTFRSIAI